MTACIIPAREEADSLPALLKLLGACCARPGTSIAEVILVTTESVDETEAICAAASSANPNFKHLIVEAKLTKFESLLAGAKLTAEDWMIFLDADVVPESECIERLAVYSRSQAKLVQAYPRPIPRPAHELYRNLVSDWIYSWSQAAALTWDDLRFNFPEYRWALSGYCYAIHRSMLPDEADCALLDDASIGLYCTRLETEIIYDRQCLVYFTPPQTLADYLSQKLRTRVGWQQLHSRYPREVRALRKELYRSIYRAAHTSGTYNPWFVRFVDSVLWGLAAVARFTGAWRNGKWSAVRTTKGSNL